MDDALADRIHRLWDELADFDAARPDAARDHLLASLCALVDAQNANWLGAVRLPDIAPVDPAHGWRPRKVIYLHPSPPIDAALAEQVKRIEQGNIDLSTVRNVAQAGVFRANRLIDLVPEEWFASAYYQAYYKGLGREDAIWAGCPVNEDAEVYFGIFRHVGRPRFGAAERETVAYALRGLKWFHRRQMLAHGLLVASTPLTAAERAVLQELLTGRPEKEIAAGLDKSHHTIHEYVTNIYRKFGVQNRAALMALWLGKAN